jgi:pimeloyl-ACP methyl ester carboxylesterase
MRTLTFTLISLIVCTQLVYAQEGNYAEVNGVKIYYEVYGEGEPLVLLHGFYMNHEMWEGWVDDFSKDYKVILVDLRGHGRSTNPSEHFTHRESAKDIYGLMDALQIETFKAMGFSSGANTLTYMAAMDSTRIESMVLIGSTSYLPEPLRVFHRSISYETADEQWMKNWEQWHPRGEAQIRSLLAQGRNIADNYEDMNFTPPYLSSIKTSTLIIHGDRDPFLPVDIPVTSYESMPNSYLWIVPNFGHSGIAKNTMWGDAFLSVVKQFLSGEWSE